MNPAKDNFLTAMGEMKDSMNWSIQRLNTMEESMQKLRSQTEVLSGAMMVSQCNEKAMRHQMQHIIYVLYHLVDNKRLKSLLSGVGNSYTQLLMSSEDVQNSSTCSSSGSPGPRMHGNGTISSSDRGDSRCSSVVTMVNQEDEHRDKRLRTVADFANGIDVPNISKELVTPLRTRVLQERLPVVEVAATSTVAGEDVQKEGASAATNARVGTRLVMDTTSKVAKGEGASTGLGPANSSLNLPAEFLPSPDPLALNVLLVRGCVCIICRAVYSYVRLQS